MKKYTNIKQANKQSTINLQIRVLILLVRIIIVSKYNDPALSANMMTLVLLDLLRNLFWRLPLPLQVPFPVTILNDNRATVQRRKIKNRAKGHVLIEPKTLNVVHPAINIRVPVECNRLDHFEIKCSHISTQIPFQFFSNKVNGPKNHSSVPQTFQPAQTKFSCSSQISSKSSRNLRRIPAGYSTI